MISQNIKSRLKKIKIILRLAQYYYARKNKKLKSGVSKLNILDLFPAYAPFSDGTYKQWEPIVVSGIQNTLGKLSKLASGDDVEIRNINTFDTESKSSDICKSMFDKHGSDKGQHHLYYKFYSVLIEQFKNKEGKLLEIGLGTNNPNVMSNMGINGKPGASLRAFRELLPQFKIYGADIDKDILFREEQIETNFVDQLDLNTYVTLFEKFGSDFNILIDDGLHAPEANLNSLIMFKEHIAVGGYIIIEDIPPAALEVWKIAAKLINQNFDVTIISCRNAYLFVAKRLI